MLTAVSLPCVLHTAYEASEKEETLTARKVGEVVSSTLGALATALDYPKSESAFAPFFACSSLYRPQRDEALLCENG